MVRSKEKRKSKGIIKNKSKLHGNLSNNDVKPSINQMKDMVVNWYARRGRMMTKDEYNSIVIARVYSSGFTYQLNNDTMMLSFEDFPIEKKKAKRKGKKRGSYNTHKSYHIINMKTGKVVISGVSNWESVNDMIQDDFGDETHVDFYGSVNQANLRGKEEKRYYQESLDELAENS